MSLSYTTFSREVRRIVGEDAAKYRFLLAVSGGIDSICMAELFAGAGFPDIALAHVNFSLRGEESDGDEKFVREWAEEKRIPLFSTRFDTASYASEHSLSIEMAARELRYVWFEKVAAENRFDFIAVAHNTNDNAETLFLNLLRGTGIGGLGGMRERSGRLIRPLLHYERSEIELFVKNNNIRFREDGTNADTEFVRNRIRHRVFPILKEVNPAFVRIMAEDMEHFREAGEILEETLAGKEGTLYTREGSQLSISLRQLNSERHPSFWLFALLKGYGFNGRQIGDIMKSLGHQPGAMFYSPEYELVTTADRIRVYPKSCSENENVLLEDGCRISFAGCSLKCDIVPLPTDFDPAEHTAGVLFLDADKVVMPLTVRNWKDADRFRPFGMKGGQKKLSDFFTGIHLDRVQKRSQPVVCDASGRIVAVPPFRIDDRFRIDSSSLRLLRIEMQSRV